jgi:mono/diheme cytochrome c family protein
MAMGRERTVLVRKVSLAGTLVLLSAAALLVYLHKPSPVQASDDSVIYLNQGWSKADRETYYHMSQGSEALSYDIFLNLEVADGQDLFRSDANTDRYGLIPQTPTPGTNPDGLPIGISKTVATNPRWKGEYIAITCAACHDSELTYKGKRIRIDGGAGNHFDFLGYVYALDDAMQATLTDSAKFDRLAARMGATSPDAKAALRQRYESEAQIVHVFRTRTLVTPGPWGPGRLDAIAGIVNRVTADKPGIPENWSTPLAPTKPPFVWNTPQSSWTQWRGAQQDPIDRNLTEAMGVLMPMDLHSKTPAEGLFDANAELLNLEKIDDLLARLAPPKWPEDVLGKIDRKKAAEGKVLFVANCTRCHNSYPYTWTAPNKYGKSFIEVGLVQQKYVGTDPGQFEDIRPYAITGQLAPYLPGPFAGKDLIPTGALYVILQKEVLETALSKLQLTDEEKLKIHGYREFPLPSPTPGVYKAAPREGVWATGPYLHNGSVPNLYEMLIPAAQRTKKFYVGREFDPVKVGVDTSGNSGKFLVDTTIRGNSNAGHSFENGPMGNGVIGPLLTEEQRWALVEYLKSIPEEDGQITPFGGPPNPKTGHGDWGN